MYMIYIRFICTIYMYLKYKNILHNVRKLLYIPSEYFPCGTGEEMRELFMEAGIL